MRLWAGKATTTPVELAAQLMALLTAAFGDREVHGVGDAAYHGKPLLVPGATWTTRLPANACLFDTAPPRTGRRGRPASKGRKLAGRRPGHRRRRGRCVSSDAGWRTTSVYRYGRTETVQLAERACIWYGSFGNTPGRSCWSASSARQGLRPGPVHPRPDRHPEQIVERYALRWSIEPANAVGKQQMGVGQARNRVKNAVERTVRSGC